MKKRALRKDFYMEIRRSMGRFLSIFFIVAIGCAFFSGIRASEPDMRYSGDVYFDRKNMMDIEVISTLGLTEDDLAAIREMDGVSAAEGGYSSDMLCTEGDNKIVVHVMSLLPSMNQVQIEEGELPEADDECALDVDYLSESSLEIGDKITLISGTDDDVSDTLIYDHRRGQQSGVYFVPAWKHDHWKRQCDHFYCCAGREFRPGCLHGDLCSGGRRERTDGFHGCI